MSFQFLLGQKLLQKGILLLKAFDLFELGRGDAMAESFFPHGIELLLPTIVAGRIDPVLLKCEGHSFACCLFKDGQLVLFGECTSVHGHDITVFSVDSCPNFYGAVTVSLRGIRFSIMIPRNDTS